MDLTESSNNSHVFIIYFTPYLPMEELENYTKNEISKFIDDYKNTSTNYINRNSKPNFLYCDNCKKTTAVKTKPKLLRTIANITQGEKDENKKYKCDECEKYYNVKLYRPVDAMTFKDKKLLLKRKLQLLGRKQ